MRCGLFAATPQFLMNQPSRGSLTPRSEEHMLGHGFYNKHSHEQGKANAYALPLIPEAIAKADLDHWRRVSNCRLRICARTKFAFADEDCVIDSFSQRLQSALAKDPQKYSCRWVLQLMVISKAG